MSLSIAFSPAIRLFKAGWLIALLMLWALLLFLPLIYFTIYPGRDQYLSLSREIGWKTGFFQGTRGRILDREGTPLAWSERQFDLNLLHALNYERRKVAMDALAIIFMERIPPLPESGGLIKSNLSPAELHRFAAVSGQLPELELSSRPLRILARPELQPLVGEINTREGVITGISGWESQFDRSLRGKIGFFTVMTAKNGQWVHDTWQLLRMPVAGQDIVVDSTLDELLEKISKHPSSSP